VRSCTAKLAIDIDRESKGAVKCEELCPEADFKYLRESADYSKSYKLKL
jgi:DNA-binding transcriptional regulator YdaS (Cro superfamily)